ncbi:hypothetical protein [Melittangium boletus]|uniref:hypothetical protein n=1 Tax=Melittangium boletus TaxID=83453 RepID=UPI003DA40825
MTTSRKNTPFNRTVPSARALRRMRARARAQGRSLEAFDAFPEDSRGGAAEGNRRPLLGLIAVLLGLVELRLGPSWLVGDEGRAAVWICQALSALTVIGPGLVLWLFRVERHRGLYARCRALVRPVMFFLFACAPVALICSVVLGGEQGRRCGHYFIGWVAGGFFRALVLGCLRGAVNDAPPPFSGRR